MAIFVHILDDKGYRVLEGIEYLQGLPLVEDDACIWIDCDERNDDIEGFLRERLHIHPLVIEDMYESCATPKIEDYGDIVYLVVHGVRRDGDDPEDVQTNELDLVLGSNWILSHHDRPSRTIDAVRADIKRNPRLMERGPAFVLHAIVDRLTDYYMPLVDRFEEELDGIEAELVQQPTPEMLQRLFALKRSLQRLRRVSVYQRDMLARLSRREFKQIPESSLPFFRDVYDHFVRIADLADSYRELVTASLEIYMTVMAHRTNEVMKILAIISVIFLPLTFITGLYGMNFDFMPGLHWHFGFWAALAGMSSVVALFAFFFWRRGWLRTAKLSTEKK